MAKIAIESKRLDTSKARHHWTLTHFDGHNMIYGDIYVSSRGQWYVLIPSQWGESWELTTAAEALECYGHILKDEDRAEMATVGKLDWE